MGIVKTSFENGKYTIQLNEGTGKLKLLRHEEEWEQDPLYSKMLISIMYEVSALRKLLSDISFDFDPEEKQGPPCGPEMLKRIKEYEEHFNVDLRFVKDINE